jgi:hypothetical protein
MSARRDDQLDDAELLRTIDTTGNLWLIRDGRGGFQNMCDLSLQR